MALSLPTSPDLERFRRDARRLQRAVRSGDADALALAARHHPDGVPDLPSFTLSAAQLVLARHYGFTSWPRLRAYLAVATPLRREPPADDVDDPVARFLTLGCLGYSGADEPARWAEAGRLLRAEPSLPERSIHAAAAIGDSFAVREQLAREPRRAQTEGGPWRWPPLMYLAYSRVPQQDPLGTARALLDAGADPNTGYLWHGLPTPFTVLSGCFGEGEDGPGRQPRHPLGVELAGLLLDRGADPNDAQTLYNRMFNRDDSHLRVLLSAGLGRGDGGVWQHRLGDALETPAEMVARQVDWAADHGFEARLRLLAEYGFGEGTSGTSPWRRRRPPRPQDRIGTPSGVADAAGRGVDLNALVDGRTLLHQAAWLGDVEMVRALLDAGADPDIVDREHGTTPLAWAEWAHADATAALLRDRTEQRNRRSPRTLGRCR
ncbi:MAG: ankyrin repeat domain-containing protein [Micropruina sp.]|uniref:ankyrin repeat domain-containing protein n=1 Tax=Micropruina sp. TaxID=2737536 RepID=UPI0039E432BC